MTIVSLIVPILILIFLLLLCYPIKTLRTIIKFFVSIMTIIIGVFVIGLIIANAVGVIINIFGF